MPSLLYELSVINDFVCLADKCPDTCCKGVWNITVKDEEVETWKQHSDESLSKQLLMSIEPFEDDGKKKYRFKMNDNGLCHHMGETGFCTIHHTNLQPHICHSYPRLSYDAGFMSVKTLKLSCPEVVRLIFQSESLRLLDTSKALRYWLNQGKDKDGIFSSSEAYMQRLVYLVWGKKQYSYQVRLAFLAKLLIYIIDSSTEVVIDKVFFDDIYTSMPSLLRDFSKKIISEEIFSESKQSAVIWGSCFAVLKKEFPELLDETTQLAKTYKDRDVDEFYTFIRTMEKEYKEELDGFSTSIDRYLEVSFINKKFPSYPYWGNYIASFLSTVIPLFCIKMALYLLLDKNGEITEQNVIDVIYKIERKMQEDFIYGCLVDSPEILEIDKYYLTLLEL